MYCTFYLLENKIKHNYRVSESGADPEHIYGGGGILNKISLKSLLKKKICKYTYSVYQRLRGAWYLANPPPPLDSHLV